LTAGSRQRFKDKQHWAGALCLSPRAFLQTIKTPNGEQIFRLAALNFLEIRMYSCENLPCMAKNLLTLGHSAGLKKRPTMKG